MNDQNEIINSWAKTWSEAGWNPMIIGEAHATAPAVQRVAGEVRRVPDAEPFRLRVGVLPSPRRHERRGRRIPGRLRYYERERAPAPAVWVPGQRRSAHCAPGELVGRRYRRAVAERRSCARLRRRGGVRGVHELHERGGRRRRDRSLQHTRHGERHALSPARAGKRDRRRGRRRTHSFIDTVLAVPDPPCAGAGVELPMLFHFSHKTMERNGMKGQPRGQTMAEWQRKRARRRRGAPSEAQRPTMTRTRESISCSRARKTRGYRPRRVHRRDAVRVVPRDEVLGGIRGAERCKADASRDARRTPSTGAAFIREKAAAPVGGTPRKKPTSGRGGVGR